MSIMVRVAQDDFAALKTAEAMELMGATVITLIPNGSSTYAGALAPHQSFQVWARVPVNVKIDDIDSAIDKELYGKEVKCSVT